MLVTISYKDNKMIIYLSAIVDHFQLTQFLAITKQDKEIIVNHDHSNNRI